MKNINLCELLKGHEGEGFYCTICGNVILDVVDDDNENYPIGIRYNENKTYLTKDGKWWNNGECILFPSKDQRDWNKWVEQQKQEVPKTFEKIPLVEKEYFTRNVPKFKLNKIQKSALALLKIHQLIEVGYGGNITNEEWGYLTYKFCIFIENDKIKTGDFVGQKLHIAFHKSQQRDEFLSYPENVQLVKDFYMI